MRLAGETCVTAVVDKLAFERPVPAGDTVVIQSYAYESGRTSVKVRLQAYRENPRTGEREATTESYFVFVAIDEDGDPVPVPDLAVESERGRELRDAAVEAEGAD
jgi:acyl-CoA hydrolase